MMEFVKKILKQNPENHANEIVAAADGRLVPMEKVPDPVFSQKMLGEGVAIDLCGDLIVAPADGVVSMLFPTGHAFGLTLENGIEILVHIGLDTVALGGRGFEPCTVAGAKVKKGDWIVRVDRDFVMKQGYNPMTIMIVTQTGGHDLNYITDGEVQRGRSVVAAF